MSRRYPDWAVEGLDWPNREASSFVAADGYDWHVQRMRPKRDELPVCILLHGTGAATHSWREIMPLLAQDFDVIAMDLPGHGFTRPNPSRRVTLPKMAESVALLLDELSARPALVIGHSAGAAVGVQLLLDRQWQVPLVGLNPALLPFPGLAAKLFPQLARMLFTNPFVSVIFARMARAPGQVEQFLKRSTGSRIDEAGVEYYRRLFSKPGHCDGAIRMMANWRLEKLESQLPTVQSPVLLVHADKDTAIPAFAVNNAAGKIPDCEQEIVTGLGHLAHEEDPEQISSMIAAFAEKHL